MKQPPTPSLLLQSVTLPEPDDRSLPPLMGFARLSTDIPFSRPLPQQPRSLLRQPATKPTTRSALVVSHHFDGFLRETAVSLLHLTASQRFAAFHRRSSPSDPRVFRGACSVASPQRVSHPSKDFPRLQPHRVTTAVAFLVLLFPVEPSALVRRPFPGADLNTLTGAKRAFKALLH